MSAYYAQRLLAERLARCCELAPPRKHRYLSREVEHLVERAHVGATLLELQAAHGLVGLIGHAASRGGVVVCTDGFRSGSARSEDFNAMARSLGVEAPTEEVDASSLWCEMCKPAIHPCSSTGAAASHRPQGDTRP